MREHGLTFPVVLQKQWEVSRDYAFFATPVAYLIDAHGIIAADVAVGIAAIEGLMAHAARLHRQGERPIQRSWAKRIISLPLRKQLYLSAY